MPPGGCNSDVLSTHSPQPRTQEGTCRGALLLRAACHVPNSDCAVYRHSGSTLQRLSVERIAARIPHLEQQHEHSLYIRLSSFYVPGTLNAEDLCLACKKCRRDVPTGVAEFPFQSIIVECALCGEKRRYLPSEVFLGRADQLVARQKRTG